MAKIEEVRFYLGRGGSFTELENPPIGWKDSNFNFNYSDNTNTLEIDSLTFANKEYEDITSIIERGDILEQHILMIEIYNSLRINQTKQQYRFQLDFTDITYNLGLSPTLTIGLKVLRNGDDLIEYFNGQTFSGLPSLDKFDYYKVSPFIVEKEDYGLELILLSLATFNMTKELIQAVKDASDIAKDISAMIVGGGFTGTLGAAIILTASAIIQAAYIVAIIIAIRQLVLQIQQLLIPIPFFRASFNITLLLEAMFDLYGYDLQYVNIPDLNKYFYVPSISDEGSNIRPNDYGYIWSEMLEIVLTMFNSKLYFTNSNIVYLGRENDPFFYKNSNYILPSNIDSPYTFNLEDYKNRRILQFLPDGLDTYTVTDYKGTSFEELTFSQSNSLVGGLDDNTIRCSLGHRKNGLNLLEIAFKQFSNVVNSVSRVFNKPDIIDVVFTDRVGYVKVSQKDSINPKIIELSDSGIPYISKSGDDRGNLMTMPQDQKISARHLFETYYGDSSFTKKENRRKIYKDVKVKWDFDSLKQIENNRVFKLEGSNESGRIIDVKWDYDGNYALVSFYIIDAYNINNLTTQTFESE